MLWVGMVLLAAGAIFLLLSQGRGRVLVTSPELTALPQIQPASVPLASGDEPIAVLFTQAGCAVCHTIPGIPGAQGKVGPMLVLGSTGAQRLADPQYRGNATTPHEYVVESILEPGAYVVPGYPDRAMPRWYGQKLSALAVEKIAAYLLAQSAAGQE